MIACFIREKNGHKIFIVHRERESNLLFFLYRKISSSIFLVLAENVITIVAVRK